MADSSNNLEILKPFYDRASEAEKRLSKLESAITTKKDVGNDELKSKLKEKEAELESVRKEAALEIKKLRIEKEKLEYRIIHLIRAVKEAESKPESKI